MEHLKEWNELQAGLAMIRADQDKRRHEKAAKKKIEEELKRKKNQEADAAEMATKVQLLPGLREDVGKGKEHLGTLNNDRLKLILVYLYEVKKSAVNKMKKEQRLQEILKQGEDSPEEPQHNQLV